MLVVCLILGLFICVEGVLRNVTCPDVVSRELDWKEMDGTWYLSAVATDLQIQGECAMVIFDHQNTLDVSIKWITNHTASYYNGSVALIPDPKSNTTGDLLQVTYDDKKTETYSFLDINYEHYAVVFACYNNAEGNSSTYEIWKMTRSPHLKKTDAAKLDGAIARYGLQDTTFMTFNNTEDTCSSAGLIVGTFTLLVVLASALMCLPSRIFRFG